MMRNELVETNMVNDIEKMMKEFIKTSPFIKTSQKLIVVYTIAISYKNHRYDYLLLHDTE